MTSVERNGVDEENILLREIGERRMGGLSETRVEGFAGT